VTVESWMNVIIVLGGAGYLYFIPTLIDLRWALERGSKGLGAALIDALLAIMGLLTLLYLIAVLRVAGVRFDEVWEGVISITSAILAGFIPWVSAVRIWVWKKGGLSKT
jgi:hypothetical protein